MLCTNFSLNSMAGVLSCLLFVSCVNLRISSIEDDGRQIPSNFGKDNITLLVIMKGKRSYDKYLEKNFKENYFGNYIIITRRGLLDEQYRNTDKYKYIFDEELHSEYSEKYGFHASAKFFLEDRNTGKKYITRRGSSAFSKWMRAYIKELEKARQKNKRY